MEAMELTESTREGWNIIAVRGRVDAVTAATLERTLTTAGSAYSQVAVDCSGIDYISSSGLRALLEGARVSQIAGHTFVVCAPSHRAKHVFDISRMHLVLKIQDALPC